MLNKQIHGIISFLIIIVGPVVSLLITPSWSVDPVNQPKMLVISIAGMIFLGIYLVSLKCIISRKNSLFLALCVLFIVQLCVVLFTSSGPSNQQFYGVFGRNTGFISYFNLTLICIAAFLVATPKLITQVSLGFIFAGVISVGYSLLQTFGADPIKWNNPYNSIVAFLGNPNFQSSFLGMLGSLLLAFCFKKQTLIIYRALAGFGILVSLMLIIRSKSQQGLIVLGLGMALVIFIFFLSFGSKNRKLILISYGSLTSVVGLLTVLGTLKIGPLGEILYKLSVRQRGYYWNAAIEMIKSHPINGVGLDSYGDWYFGVRSAGAALNTPKVTSNSAHSVFLDIGSNGGIPLLAIYIGLVALTLRSIFKYLRRNQEFNWAYAGLVSVWVGYQAQSVISINQLGLAIWGWLLMGLLIGIEVNSREKSNVNTQSVIKGKGFSKISNNANSSNSLAYISAAISLIIGLFIVFPVFLNDMNSRKSSSGRSAEVLIATVLKQPEDTSRTIEAAQILARSNLLPQALQLVNHVIEINPRAYNAWELKLQITDPSSPDYQSIKDQMNFLNPRVPIK
jgi:O-antigen ligase